MWPDPFYYQDVPKLKDTVAISIVNIASIPFLQERGNQVDTETTVTLERPAPEDPSRAPPHPGHQARCAPRAALPRAHAHRRRVGTGRALAGARAQAPRRDRPRSRGRTRTGAALGRRALAGACAQAPGRGYQVVAKEPGPRSGRGDPPLFSFCPYLALFFPFFFLLHPTPLPTGPRLTPLLRRGRAVAAQPRVPPSLRRSRLPLLTRHPAPEEPIFRVLRCRQIQMNCPGKNLHGDVSTAEMPYE
nr:uncharacterized protein LOC105883312 [Microcebus murinus]